MKIRLHQVLSLQFFFSKKSKKESSVFSRKKASDKRRSNMEKVLFFGEEEITKSQRSSRKNEQKKHLGFIEGTKSSMTTRRGNLSRDKRLPVSVFERKLSQQRISPVIVKKGFTLLEIIIYITISSIAIVGIMQITSDIFKTQKQIKMAAEITQTAEFLMKKITDEVHNATNLNEGSSVFSNPGTLSLDQNGDEIVIDSYLKNIDVNGQAISIRKIQRTQFGDSYDLTKDTINVTSFNIENLSRNGDSQNININITLQYRGNAGISMGVNPVQLEKSISFRNQ